MQNRLSFDKVFFGQSAFLEHVYHDDYQEFPELFPQIFNVEGMDRPQRDVTSLTGLGTMSEIEEGDTFPTDQFLPGYSKTLKAKQFAILIEISKLAIDDDEYGIFTKVPKALSRAYKATKEFYAWGLLMGGLQSIGTELTADGRSIFNSSHPYIDPLAGSFSNYAAADVAEDSLEAALTSQMDQTNDRGIPIVQRVLKLWVASGGAWPASRLLDSAQRSGVMTNDINAFSKVVPYLSYDWSPYISDPDAAFLVGEKSNHTLTMLMRQELENDYDVDFRTKTAMISGDARWVGGCAYPQGLYGFSGE